MKSMSKSLKALMVIGCSVMLVATSASAQEWQVPAEWKFLKFAGGAAAGTFTPLTAKLSELINQNIPGVNASSTLGGGYSNAEAINSGKIQLAMDQATTLSDVYYGLSEKYKGKELKDIRYLASMHPAVMYIYVPKRSPIKDFSEVARKPWRIATGPVGSFTYNFVETLLKVHGTSIKDLEQRGGTAHRVYYAEGVNMMKDGHLDVMTHFTGLHASVLMDAAAMPGGIRFLELAPEKQNQLMKELYGTTDYLLPKEMYPGIEKDYPTIAFFQPVIVHKDMPEELAYRITKVIWDNLKEIQAIGTFAKDIKLKTAFKGVTIPMHPGAERYYREKGMTVPSPKPPKM